MKVLYTAVATADGGRAGGQVRSSDGNIELPVSPPKELGGEGAGTNPEQLFAAGYAACFHSAVMIIARRMDQDASDSNVWGRQNVWDVYTKSTGTALDGSKYKDW